MVRSQMMGVESSQTHKGEDQGNSCLRIQSIHKGYVKMTTETAKLSWRLLGSLSAESFSPTPGVHICSYSGYPIIRTSVWHYNLNTAQISALVWVSEKDIKSYCITFLDITTDTTDKRALLLYE